MNDEGAHYEIWVDGKVRSSRDQHDVALEAARYLMTLHPNSKVVLRDRRTNVSTPVEWSNGD
jgi:hypothetical protein